MSRESAIITAILSYVICIASFLYARIWVKISKERENTWPQVKAKIVKRFDSISSIATGSSSFVASYHITYEYDYNGTTYQGAKDCAPIDNSTSDYEHNEKINGKFKIGNTIPIYVNPKRPEKSLLYVKTYDEHMSFYLLSIIFIIGGTVLLFVYWNN